MFDLALDPSETRPLREPAPPARRGTRVRTLVIGGACLAGLVGFGVAASSVMADLVAPSRPLSTPVAAQGRAADWPDLKDGLPALAGAEKAAPAAETASAPRAPRMASLSDPLAYAAAPAAPGAAVMPAAVSPAPAAPAAPTPVATRPAPEAPTRRIPVATPAALLAPTVAARLVPPPRTVASLAPQPSETVRARDETPRAREEVAERPAPSKPAPAVAAAAPAHAQPPAAEKPRKTAAARRPNPAAVPHGAEATVAEAEPEETNILGMNLPSLAPAGRKLQEGVDALGNAVRSAF